MMTLKIGKRMQAEVATFAEASRIYSQARNESGEGASTFPVGRLTGGYYVSYNGRVWKGNPRGAMDLNNLVFDNRTTEGK